MAFHFIPPERRRLDGHSEWQRRTLHEATMNDAAIGRMVNRKRSTIRFWRITRGLASNVPKKRASPEEIEAFLSLHAIGHTDADIARQLARSRETVTSWRRSRGLPSNLAKFRASQGPDVTKLNEMIRLHAQGMLDEQIGQNVGRDRSTISSWRRRLGLPSNRPVGSSCVNPRYARSLDAPMFEDGGQLYNIIRDDSWSNWLEEMGATVW